MSTTGAFAGPRLAAPDGALTVEAVVWAGLPIALVLAAVSVTGFAIRESAPSVLLTTAGAAGIGLLLTAFLVRGEGRARAIQLYLLAFAWNAAMAVLMYLALEGEYGVPFFHGGSDDRFYHHLGLSLARTPAGGEGGIQNAAEASKYVGYPLTVALIHRAGDLFGGAHSLNPRIVNAGVAGLISVVIHRLGTRAGVPRAGYLAGALLAVYPFMTFHHVLVLRDSIIALLVATGVLVWKRTEVEGRRHLGAYTLVAALVGVLLPFRETSAALLVVALLGLVGLRLIRRTQRRRLVLGGLGLLVLVALAIPLFIQYGQTALRYYDLYLALLGRRSESGSVAMLILGLPFPFDYLARIPFALIWPIPIPGDDPADTLRNLGGALMWYPFLPFVVAGWLLGFRDPELRSTAVVAAVFFVAVAFTTLAYRHMSQYVPLLFLLGAVGLQRLGRERLILMVALGTLGAAATTTLYLMLKLIT